MKLRPAAAVAAICVLAAACGSPSASSNSSGKFTFLGLVENTTPADTLTALSKGPCAATNQTTKLSTDSTPQTQLDQKLQLLAGQSALPNGFVAPGTPATVTQLIKANHVVDISKELAKQGLSDEILPAAASTIKLLYGQSDVYALPNEFNIEGIWYNKKIFAAHNLQVPGTWDELVSVTQSLQAAHLQPFTADGKDGWDVTRFVGAYIFRSLGPDALQKVADGKAKLTDPGYVKAAAAVSALGKSGAFGANAASNDYNGTVNDFLSGKAAMMYMVSWVLSNLNDPAQNKVGTDAIGFMPFPAVNGGAGSIDQIPANAGQPLMLSQKAFDSGSQAWLKCIATNYGDQVLDKSGVISGFKLHNVHNLPALTQVVQDQIGSAKSSVLWFEALFSAKATTASQTNGGLLGNGTLSGADFMQKVQDSF
jgi:raffinose/stachyose/melibiose transport system substrate-binding protein